MRPFLEIVQKTNFSIARVHMAKDTKLLIADLTFLNKIGMFYQQISIS